MVVILLEAIHYPPREDWHSIKTESPKWRDIKSAISRLDRDEWPFVWLHTELPIEFEMPENMLCVMGGRGEYAITLYRNGDEIDFFDSSRKNEREIIRIWESDQGSERWPKNLCNDLALTHSLVKTFCQTGELDSNYRWQTN